MIRMMSIINKILRNSLPALLLLFCPLWLSAQRISVSGNVTDDAGEPLAGVTIIEKGTTKGSTSNADGNFTITVERADAILSFSCLGFMTQDIQLRGRNQLSVKMQDDALSLSEAVVTGYGQVVSKEKLTAAISKVGGDELSKGSHSNAIQALSGNVTGVMIATTTGQPGSAPNIVIRGGAALAPHDPQYP